MHINRMRLVNYRNYKDVSPVFSPETNILYGDNGQGKTNLLEAIFLMCRGYSHRASRTRELIGFDQEALFTASEFRSNDINHKLSLKAIKGKKGWKFDGKTENSFSNIQPYVGCIIFEPDDLEIVKGGPELRRRFINWELSGLVPTYRPILREYERVRQQRNALLRQYSKQNIDMMDLRSIITPWNDQLVKAASKIYRLRNNYLKQLSPKAQEFHSNLSGTNEKLSLLYQTNVFKEAIPSSENEILEIYRNSLEEGLQRDLERGYTRLGPHSDDLQILINDHPARIYASQGQQRTAAISLKLAHIDLYKENLNLLPIVLLDDILSELDDTRQRNILSVLQGAQTFITCTNPSFSSHLGNSINKIHIENGSII